MIKFIKLRIPAFIFSLCLILIGLWFLAGPSSLNFSLFTPKGLNLGVDFQGGLVHQVTIYSGISADEVRDFAVKSKLGSEIVQVIIADNKRIGKAVSYQIKTIITKEEQKTISEDPNLTTAKFLNDRVKMFYGLIEKKYGKEYVLTKKELEKTNKIYKNRITGEKVELRTKDKRVLKNVVKESENVISPVYSKGLRLQVVFLVLFVLFLMLLYISFRFKFKYAVGAIFALIHDMLIIIGFISVSGLELDYTIIAALLFTIGYSLNDTIVIFDRVRENYNIMKDSSSKKIINTSINQSLNRTIITSFTTLLAVLALYIWGGSKINGFSLTLIVGIFSGTYSSVFIASPVVDSWDKFFANKKIKLNELKKEEEEPKKLEEEKVIEKKEGEKTVLSKKQLKKMSGKKKKK